MRDRLLLAIILAVAVVLAGCGGHKNVGAGSSFAPVVTAQLTPDAVTEGNGQAGASGHARITLDPQTGNVCWIFEYIGLDKPVSAHIVKGMAGEKGTDVLRLGVPYARKGCVLSHAHETSDIGRNPGDYYVIIFTHSYPHGAIRGQLVAGASTSTTTT
jgi:hypothetical protein